MQPDAVTGDDRRYRMLEPIREYAMEQLRQSDELDGARDRHIRYHVTVAEQLDAVSFGPQEASWFCRTAREYENFRAALRWAIERRDGDLSLRFTVPLVPFWVWSGLVREGRQWLKHAPELGQRPCRSFAPRP